jgi:hypothetical protein
MASASALEAAVSRSEPCFRNEAHNYSRSNRRAAIERSTATRGQIADAGWRELRRNCTRLSEEFRSVPQANGGGTGIAPSAELPNVRNGSQAAVGWHARYIRSSQISRRSNTLGVIVPCADTRQSLAIYQQLLVAWLDGCFQAGRTSVTLLRFCVTVALAHC